MMGMDQASMQRAKHGLKLMVAAGAITTAAILLDMKAGSLQTGLRPDHFANQEHLRQSPDLPVPDLEPVPDANPERSESIGFENVSTALEDLALKTIELTHSKMAEAAHSVSILDKTIQDVPSTTRTRCVSEPLALPAVFGKPAMIQRPAWTKGVLRMEAVPYIQPTIQHAFATFDLGIRFALYDASNTFLRSKSQKDPAGNRQNSLDLPRQLDASKDRGSTKRGSDKTDSAISGSAGSQSADPDENTLALSDKPKNNGHFQHRPGSLLERMKEQERTKEQEDPSSTYRPEEAVSIPNEDIAEEQEGSGFRQSDPSSSIQNPSSSNTEPVLQPGEVVEITEIYTWIPVQAPDTSQNMQESAVAVEQEQPGGTADRANTESDGSGIDPSSSKPVFEAGSQENPEQDLPFQNPAEFAQKPAMTTGPGLSDQANSTDTSADQQERHNPSSVKPEKNPSKEDARPDQPEPYHPVLMDLSKVDYGFHCRLSKSFLSQIQKGSTTLSYSGSLEEAREAIDELVTIYCCSGARIAYYPEEDEEGNKTIRIEESDANWIVKAVKKGDAAWQLYLDAVQEIVESIKNLPTEREQLEAINKWICTHYVYEMTNNGLSEFARTKVGQCWHFAKLFADSCKASGIDVVLHSNLTHSWVEVKTNGKSWRFDPAFNATCGDITAYNWQRI